MIFISNLKSIDYYRIKNLSKILKLRTLTASVSLHLSFWGKISALCIGKQAEGIFSRWFFLQINFLVMIYQTIPLYIQVIFFWFM